MARVVLPGSPHHITQRGVRSLDIFMTKSDRMTYLEQMKTQCAQSGVQIISYCLMTNHVHLIAIPQNENSLRKGIGEAHRLYTRMINFREGTRGYLFQGRFYSCPLDEVHMIATLKYIQSNPVRAKIIKKAWEYEWSSAQFHMGLKKSDPLVEKHYLLEKVIDWKSLH